MKLFQINITANLGSTGRITEEIGRLAIANGWESYIAYGRAAENSVPKLIHVGNMWDERWHAVQTRLFDSHGLASKKATRDLVREIDKLHPDIIHLHNIHGYYLNYPILFNYLSKINTPIVWTLHDCWTMTGHCAHFDFVGCQKWKTGCHDCQLKRSYPSSLLIDNSKRNYALKKHYFTLPNNMTIVAVSDWLADLVKQSFFKKYLTITIYNGIDLRSFQRRLVNNKLSDKPIVLGVASVWTDRKGLADFVKLSNYDDIQIILIGVNEKVKKILPKNIICVKRTSSKEELAVYYSMADVFVNPTYEDTFGLVNVEAQACGTPVVTYRTGGCPETISSDTGILVEKGDVEGLYEAIKSVLGKSSEEKEVRKRACLEKAKEFDCKIRFKEYIELYEKLLNKR